MRARTPLLYVVTPDEERAERLLLRLASELNSRVLFWSVTQGFFDRQGESASSGESVEPEAALRHIAQRREEALFVLRDLHPYLADPRVQRRLRDAVRALRNQSSTCVLVAPLLKLPTELRHEVEVVTLGPPTPEERRRLVSRVLSSVNRGASEAQISAATDALQGLSEVRAEDLLLRSLVRQGAIEPAFIQEERARLLDRDPQRAQLDALLADPPTARALRALASDADLQSYVLFATEED